LVILLKNDNSLRSENRFPLLKKDENKAIFLKTANQGPPILVA